MFHYNKRKFRNKKGSDEYVKLNVLETDHNILNEQTKRLIFNIIRITPLILASYGVSKILLFP